MSEAEQIAQPVPEPQPVDAEGHPIPPPAPPPLDQQADPAAPPQAPVDLPPSTPAPDPIAERVVALEVAVAEHKATMEALSDAWMHFAQAGERVLAECRALAQGSESANVINIEARLKIIEASRV